MTEEVFRRDAYARSCESRVTAVDDAGVRLDRTVFYPLGGGQPGDSGELVLDGGAALKIVDTRKGAVDGEIDHVPEGPVDAGIVGARARSCTSRRRRSIRVWRGARSPPASTGSGGIGSCGCTPACTCCARSFPRR